MATTSLPTITPILTPDGNRTRYLQETRRFPRLEKQQEYRLAKA